MKLPKISIVTPSFNQGLYIEEAIRSVLLQNYPNLEYIIIDGNSTDQSIEVIKSYEAQLTYWVSESDDGQYDAINKGISKTTGEIMAWINSDDKYTPWAFSIVGEIFSRFPQIEWLTTGCALHWDHAGRAVSSHHKGGYNRLAFFKGANLPGKNWFSSGWIQQESTFWRRSLWDRAGGSLDASLKLAGDFELWSRFFSETDLYTVLTPLGGFRIHSQQKTASRMTEYVAEAEKVMRKHGGQPSGMIESVARQFFGGCIGPRAIPSSLLPSWSRAVLDKKPFLYPVKQCYWISNDWHIRDAYII
jgi:glycosyltransferase involved in cell wall biosynthesis